MTFHRLFPRASILLLAFWLGIGPALGQGLLRDAEIEHGLAQLAAPILRAAGLAPDRVKILLVDDQSLNAFVISNDAIYIHSGLIARAQSAAMIQAVIAHEAAHIVNGHISRRMTNLDHARNAAGLGLALAAAAAVAGQGDAARGIALGTGSAAQRSFFSHTRAEESSADQSGIRFMASAGVAPAAMRDLLAIFSGQELLSAGRQDPYLRSHPLSRDRMRAIDGFVAQYKGGEVLPQTEYWFARLRGKLSAFTRSPKWTLAQAPSDPVGDAGLMRQAIARHRLAQTPAALALLDQLQGQRPEDAFLYDLRGQMLIEARDFNAAARAYQQAARLAPGNALILAGLGRAQLATGAPAEARATLERSRDQDFRNSAMMRDLALAYARTQKPGLAAMITAERFALMGRMKDAGLHARRALGQLPEGSAPWQRAQDVLIASERAANGR